MDLHLRRTEEYAEATIGELLREDGTRLMFVREERARMPRDGMFVPNESCVPAGRYRMTIAKSRRYNALLPFLWHVRHDFGVFVHPGRSNEALDEAATLLVGHELTNASIGQTKQATRTLVHLLANAAARRESVELLITDPPKGTP